MYSPARSDMLAICKGLEDGAHTVDSSLSQAAHTEHPLRLIFFSKGKWSGVRSLRHLMSALQPELLISIVTL